MPAFNLSFAEAQRAVRILEEQLEAGYPPTGHTGSNKLITATTQAAMILGWEPETARSRFGSPAGIRKGSIYLKHGIKVDWSKYRPPPPPPLPPPPEPPPIIVAPPAPPPDYVRERADKEKIRELTDRVKIAEQRAHDAEQRERAVLGLVSDPLTPRIVMPKGEVTANNRTVVLFLSDIHYGETILAEEMDGMNRYDADIAKARLGRFFAKSAELMTDHWKGQPPDEIVLCLGGDLISGSIHDELEITDYPTVPQAVKEVGEHIAGGIVLLHSRVQRPIRVLCVPGNHGRSTERPRSKRRATSSFDLLAADFCEATLKGSGVTTAAFYKTHSPDALFSVYGWHFLLTHGDTMGSKGGMGFVGPMATIVRGHIKLLQASWRAGRSVHYVLTAHLHTLCKSPYGYGNGSVCGYGEYARDLRADPEPARQHMLVVHPYHGVINEVPLYLGAPDEGSLYAGPATVVRPTWEGGDVAEAL